MIMIKYREEDEKEIQKEKNNKRTKRVRRRDEICEAIHTNTHEVR